MSDEPVAKIGELLGGIAERMGQYGEVWQRAAAANARGEYTADDAVADMTSVMKQAAKDMIETSAAMIEMIGAFAPAASESRSATATATAKKKTATKKKAATTKRGK